MTTRKKASKSLKKVTKMSDEEIQKASDEIIQPGLNPEKVNFMGTVFNLRALPIGITKKLNTLTRPIMLKFAKATRHAEADDAAEVAMEASLDEPAVNIMVESVNLIFKFYGETDLGLKLEDHATVDDLYRFLNAQLELNGKNDFLLQPLRMLLKIVEANVAAEAQM